MNGFLSLRRPVYVFTLVFFACTAVLVSVGERVAWQVALSAAVAVCLVLCVPPLRRIACLTVAVCAVLLSSALVYARYLLVVHPIQMTADSTITVNARVESLPKGESQTYIVRTVGDGALPNRTKLLVRFENTELLPDRWDVVSGNVWVSVPGEPQRYVYGDGIFLYGDFDAQTQVVGHTDRWYERLGASLREKVLTGIRKALPDEEGNLVAGVCLGETALMSDQVTAQFRRSGLAHLVVVSGLHMTVLAGALYALFRACRIGRRWAAVLSLVPVWLFVLMVGFSPSVVRAAVMLHFVLLGDVLQLRADTRTSLAVALLLILLYNPYAATDVGFLLSFAATLGLVVLSPLCNSVIGTVPGTRRCERWRGALQALGCPVAATGFTAPIVSYAFGGISVLSPVSNLLAVWPGTVLLYLGMIGGVMSCIPGMDGVARVAFLLTGAVAKWILWVAERISALSVSWMSVQHTVILVLITVLPIAALYAYRLLQRRGLRRVLITGVALLLVCSSLLCVMKFRTVSVRICAMDNAFVAAIGFGNRVAAMLSGDSRAVYSAAWKHFSDCRVDRLDALVVTDGAVNTTAPLAELLESYPAKTVIYPQTPVDMTAGIGDIQRESFEEEYAFSLWDRVSISMVGDWWRIRIGETDVVIAPESGDAGVVPEEWCEPSLMMVRGSVPQNMQMLSPERVMLLCEERRVSVAARDLPQNGYPVHIAVREGGLQLLTTGDGVLYDADRLWI